MHKLSNKNAPVANEISLQCWAGGWGDCYYMKIYTVKELSESSGYSETHIRRLINEGVIKATRIGLRAFVITGDEAKKIKKQYGKPKRG